MVRITSVVLLGGFLASTMASCASVASVDAAPDAANPACAEMMVVLPEVIGDAERRPTSSQATSAWGDPSQVVLRCGVEVPGPTTDPCVSVNNVDWVAHEDKSGIWTLTTYGRTPATEVVLDPTVIPSSTVLATLSDSASRIPAQKQCTSVEKDEKF
ncbi:DUF3515 family protein [Glutamicibacter sp.]|uniref:DUF3515 family protein n=1 Tax=Glutamicibacter sp. TaxID=1931995 RepID=UPI0028BE6F3B|nr:DUF3515 family protein [Glutamicibacter sp.]